ncbi:hypothetical protein N656DRAFT_1140 [Canariomyces notabilis]|uniref:Uncharacterized protein n=1 Tax=Canariomyces notabilis TaxID=2074819 RepID=A0AAN6TMZ1_9PEZI|nr:hypothetical protein N656DRAFT_1140 [Canariomyces arenarius]
MLAKVGGTAAEHIIRPILVYRNDCIQSSRFVHRLLTAACLPNGTSPAQALRSMWQITEQTWHGHQTAGTCRWEQMPTPSGGRYMRLPPLHSFPHPSKTGGHEWRTDLAIEFPVATDLRGPHSTWRVSARDHLKLLVQRRSLTVEGSPVLVLLRGRVSCTVSRRCWRRHTAVKWGLRYVDSSCFVTFRSCRVPPVAGFLRA